MAGRAPRGEIRAAVREPEPGLVEIDLVNAGDGEAAAPSTVRVRWKGETFLAADGLAGYRVTPGKGEIRLDRPRPASWRPEERRTVAWLRLASRTEIHVELPKNPG